MSQAKVDKYKEEKKNRSKIMKRNKIKKVLLVLVTALGLGAIIGIPLGKFIYNKQKEIEAKNRTIATAEYDNWFEKKWAGEYAETFKSAAQDKIDEFNSASDAAEPFSDEEDDDAVELDGDDIEIDGDDIELDEDDLEVEE